MPPYAEPEIPHRISLSEPTVLSMKFLIHDTLTIYLPIFFVLNVILLVRSAAYLSNAPQNGSLQNTCTFTMVANIINPDYSDLGPICFHEENEFKQIVHFPIQTLAKNNPAHPPNKLNFERCL